MEEVREDAPRAAVAYCIRVRALRHVRRVEGVLGWDGGCAVFRLECRVGGFVRPTVPCGVELAKGR